MPLQEHWPTKRAIEIIVKRVPSSDELESISFVVVVKS
jgi:hypothetical protein